MTLNRPHPANREPRPRTATATANRDRDRDIGSLDIVIGEVDR